MVAPIKKTTSWREKFDTIIDVRSPSEYHLDHIPNAINLPVLDDAERSEIGTIYKQTSPFRARQIGAQYVARNIARHLDGLMEHERQWRPLIYCWRGGQRSAAMARIFAEIGWVTHILEGGYKTYRREVIARLDNAPAQYQFILLQGPTGTAKTHILKAASKQGVQIIDLEGIASHRGSLLGAEPDTEQPSQRLFESLLYHALSSLDSHLPVLLEAESSRIGQCHIPQKFWQHMTTAPQIHINASLQSRINFLINDYKHLIADTPTLERLINGMLKRHGHEITSQWRGLAHDQKWEELVGQLISQHYDPAYQNAAKRKKLKTPLAVIEPTSLNDTEIQKAAQKITQIFSKMPQN